MKLLLQKNAKVSSAGGSAPRPPCLRWLGALPQTPSLRQLGASPPDPHWPPAAGGSAPRPPKQPPPHCEFLATRLTELMLDDVAQRLIVIIIKRLKNLNHMYAG